MESPHHITIAGAGIAGLTAALAFAREGFSVRIFEQAASLDEAGAGLQLSPNATRVLERLGVLETLLPRATLPEAITIREANSLRQIARLPLHGPAGMHLAAPYLAVHRADLQAALVERVAATPNIELVTGTRLTSVRATSGGFDAVIERDGAEKTFRGALMIGADGVHSRVRDFVAPDSAPRRSGYGAWRTTMRREELSDPAAELLPANEISTLVHPRFHLVAYPVRRGYAINLVVVSLLESDPGSSSGSLPGATRAVWPRALSQLIQRDVHWRLWPISEVAPAAWSRSGSVALIGDAAHAMTPFAAQGAAMGIEDAQALATLAAARRDHPAQALALYERLRRERVGRVAARGRFNRFAWHARGPIALARNMVLALRGSQRLVADLDWIYGHDAEAAAIDLLKRS